MCLCNHMEADQTAASLRLKKKKKKEEVEMKKGHSVKNHGATELLRCPRVCSLLGIPSVSGEEGGVRFPAPPTYTAVKRPVKTQLPRPRPIHQFDAFQVGWTSEQAPPPDSPRSPTGPAALKQILFSKRRPIYGTFPSNLSSNARRSHRRHLPSICYKFHFPTHNL